MKKIAAIAFLALFGMGYSFGQDTTYTPPPTPAVASTDSPSLRMGLSVSPVFSWFGIEDGIDFAASDGTRFNVQYGLHIDKRLGGNPNYYLSTGVFVTNMGGSMRYTQAVLDDDDNGSSEYQIQEVVSDFRFNYISVPVNLMLRTNEIGYMTYFARVGFDAGFNIEANHDYTITGSNETFENEDASELVDLFRAGLHVEGGMEYNFSGNTRLMVGIEWNNGLNNVFNKDFNVVRDNNIEDPTTEPDTKKVKGQLNAIKLNVGIYF